jgi:hypothetical protein
MAYTPSGVDLEGASWEKVWVQLKREPLIPIGMSASLCGTNIFCN